MTESELQQHIQIQAVRLHTQLMRNNVGAFTDASGRHVRFGLGNISKKRNDQIKSSDLIGFRSRIITPSDVGRAVAIFSAIECKSEGWKFNPNDKHEVAQKAFIDWVKNHGGYAGFASSIYDLSEILQRV